MDEKNLEELVRHASAENVKLKAEIAELNDKIKIIQQRNEFLHKYIDKHIEKKKEHNNDRYN
tara:strand:- start:257 stop:442 length:186 start_codon:yes stop_codon:yes gene_type:complete